MRPKHYNDYAHGKNGWVGGNPRYGKVRGNNTGYRLKRNRRYQDKQTRSAIEEQEMSMRTVTTCSTRRLGQLVRDGLEAAHPNYEFAIFNSTTTGDPGCSVMVRTSAQGLRLVAPAVLVAMERFAAGYLAALKAHFTGLTS